MEGAKRNPNLKSKSYYDIFTHMCQVTQQTQLRELIFFYGKRIYSI